MQSTDFFTGAAVVRGTPTARSALLSARHASPYSAYRDASDKVQRPPPCCPGGLVCVVALSRPANAANPPRRTPVLRSCIIVDRIPYPPIGGQQLRYRQTIEAFRSNARPFLRRPISTLREERLCGPE